MKLPNRVLVANRAEIAVRIIRAARSLGIETVAIYSDADEGAKHVRLADQAISLRGVSARDTYLNQEKVINAAIQSNADCIHPGYGFFGENPDFAEAAIDAGLLYIGPAPDSIRAMASKSEARRRVSDFDVPIVPGTEPLVEISVARDFAKRVGFPIVIKASAGGSGRGMRVVHEEKDLEGAIDEAKREAKSAFGNDEVFCEKYLDRPRHIEVQILGDRSGRIIHLGERECSLQRRHQKLVEESPAPNLHPSVREWLCEAAIRAAKSVNYLNAGTVEFLVEGGETAKSNFYFLEMNTRIQVEHPVTEETTGLDLVGLQFMVAAGEDAPAQGDVHMIGHAIEFRVSAEDPAKEFSPTTGEIIYMSRIGGPGVREDGWIEAGSNVSPYYDSLLSKVIVSGANREAVLSRAGAVLGEFVVEGVETTLGFHRWLLENEEFKAGRVDIGWVERNYRGEIRHGFGPGPLELPKKKKRQTGKN